MVSNFIWLYVDFPTIAARFSLTDQCSLVEMWLGIICTCLPILYTFVRTQILQRQGSRSVASSVVQNTNGSKHNRSVAARASGAGYYPGEHHFESDVYKANDQYSVRAVDSDRNLLMTPISRE